MLTRFLAPLLLLQYASAAVHKVQLKKVEPAAFNFEAEVARLAARYGGSQTPLTNGFAAPGRFASRPTKDGNGDQSFRTQGTHQVPLTSMSRHRLRPACCAPLHAVC